MKPAPGTKIVEFAEMLGYPDVQKFMALNSDKVKTTEAGVPYVDVNTDYPDYSEIGRAPASTEPASANTLNLDGVTAAASAPMPDNSTQGGSENLSIDLISNLSPDLQTVAMEGITSKTADSNPEVKLSTDMMFTDGRENVSPAPGMINVTETQTTSSGYDMKEAEKLLEEQLSIQTRLNNLNLFQGEKETKERLAAIKDLNQQDEELKLAQEERQRQQRLREEELMAQVSAATNEYKSAEVDPDRLFKKKGTGSKILAALAAGLGAYASAMTGTKNFALDIINSAIDDDIDAQKTEIAQKAGAITEQRNLLNDLIRKGMSDTEAEKAARVIMIERVELQLKERLEKISGSAAKQQGQLLQEQLNNEKQLKLEELKQAAAPKTVTITKQQPSPALKLQQKFDESKAAALGRKEGEKEAAEKTPLSEKDKLARKVPGFVGYANTQKQAETAIQANKDIENLDQALDELIQIKKDYGYDNPLYSEARKSAETKSILMIGMLKSKAFLDLGVLQEADVKLLSKAVPMDPLGQFNTDIVLAQYQALKDYVATSRDIIFGTLGLTPETGVRVDMTKDDLRNQFRSSQSIYSE
jgi:hypothetical protein